MEWFDWLLILAYLAYLGCLVSDLMTELSRLIELLGYWNILTHWSTLVGDCHILLRILKILMINVSSI